METLSILPDVDIRSKFGSVQFGYDRIIKIREEFGALMKVASLVTGVAPEDLTVKTLREFAEKLEREQDTA